MLIVPAQGHQAGRGAVVFFARGFILGSASTVGAFVVTCVVGGRFDDRSLRNTEKKTHC